MIFIIVHIWMQLDGHLVLYMLMLIGCLNVINNVSLSVITLIVNLFILSDLLAQSSMTLCICPSELKPGLQERPIDLKRWWTGTWTGSVTGSLLSWPVLLWAGLGPPVAKYGIIKQWNPAVYAFYFRYVLQLVPFCYIHP